MRAPPLEQKPLPVLASCLRKKSAVPLTPWEGDSSTPARSTGENFSFKKRKTINTQNYELPKKTQREKPPVVVSPGVSLAGPGRRAVQEIYWHCAALKGARTTALLPSVLIAATRPRTSVNQVGLGSQCCVCWVGVRVKGRLGN